MMDRRLLLKYLSASSAMAAVGTASLAMAKAPTDKRLIFILQRGAQDGLHALIPYDDADYRAYRPGMAIPVPGQPGGALDLDGRFGVHPALTSFQAMWRQGELAAVPAVATRYRERSHFDGQNLLENGAGAPNAARDGFLNRALQGFGDPGAKLGMAFGHTIPLALRGEAEVTSWAPSTLPEVDDDFLRRLLSSYGDDAIFARALKEGMAPMPMDMDLSRREKRLAAFGRSLEIAAEAAAEALLQDDGPRIALLESDGWDTHNAALRRLENLFIDLDGAMVSLRDRLKLVWDKTLIVTMSEFGRTVRENGAGGTDHGTGGVTFVAGGAVNGGRLHGDWPGLAESALYEGRDIFPANALESVLKAVLVNHLGLESRFVESTVLPGADDAALLKGLIG